MLYVRSSVCVFIPQQLVNAQDSSRVRHAAAVKSHFFSFTHNKTTYLKSNRCHVSIITSRDLYFVYLWTEWNTCLFKRRRFTALVICVPVNNRLILLQMWERTRSLTLDRTKFSCAQQMPVTDKIHSVVFPRLRPALQTQGRAQRESPCKHSAPFSMLEKKKRSFYQDRKTSAAYSPNCWHI